MTEPKLLDQARHIMRIKHYSYRTEQTYIHWMTRFILFNKRPDGVIPHPRDLGAAEVEAFLSHLAVEGHVAASTQNVAMQARPLPLSPGAAHRTDRHQRPARPPG